MTNVAWLGLAIAMVAAYSILQARRGNFAIDDDDDDEDKTITLGLNEPEKKGPEA